MLKIKLKDNSELEVEEGLSVIEIAKKISNNNIVIPANKVKVITNYKMI